MIDVLIVFTMACLALGAYNIGFQVSIPHFLRGDFDWYLYNEDVGEEPKQWHKVPPALNLPEMNKNEYAIIRVDEVSKPQNVVKRILWFPLLYDILLTTSAVMIFVLIAWRYKKGTNCIS